MTAADPEVHSVAEAAARLRVSERHLRRLIEQGDIPALRFGRVIRISRVQLDALISGGVKPEVAS